MDAALRAKGHRHRSDLGHEFRRKPDRRADKISLECDNLGLDVYYDLEKIAGIRDTKFEIAMSQRSGTSLTNDYIGNVFNAQQVFGGETCRLTDLNLQRYFCDDKIDLVVGRIITCDDFLVSPYFGFFMSSAIDGNPVSVFKDSPGMTQIPTTPGGLACA